jgi:hypothetical protein
MAGIIAGALHGLGGQMVNIGNKFLDAQIEETKATRLLELQAQYRRADAQQAHELGMARDESRYNLENKDRLAIASELKDYGKPREETLPPDQAGPVGTVTPGDADIARRGGLISSRMGRPDIAKQYKDLGEPGKLETLAAEEAAQARRDERQAAAAKDLKKSEDSPSQVRLRDATADAQGANASRLRSDPDRQDRRETIATARDMMNGGTRALAEINTEVKTLETAIQAATGDEKAVLLRDRRALEARRQEAIQMQKDGRAMLQRLESGGGRGAASSGSGAREQAPFESFFGKGAGGFGDVKAETEKSKPTQTAARAAPSGFTRAEQELIDEQSSPAGKQRVRNDILRQRRDQTEREAAAQREREARQGEADYSRRGVDPRRAAY